MRKSYIENNRINGYKEFFLKLFLEPMTNKENEWEKQNKLRDWKRHNQEEGKKIAILTQQVDKSTKWKTLRTIFNPTNIYQILEPLAE